MIYISKDRLKTINLANKFTTVIKGIGSPEFYGPTGTEHYILLAYFSMQFNGRDIFDIGTHYGASALALSYNDSNTVYSFDITDKISIFKGRPQTVKNIKFNIENICAEEGREKWKDKLLSSAIIFIDITPHSGIEEYNFYLFLLKHQYKGIIIADDIHYFNDMKHNFWTKIYPEHQLDLTSYGHWSGTGIINITHTIEIELEMNNKNTMPKEKNWTLVTAYFDLTKCPDATDAIKARDSKYYLQYSTGCLSLNYNMVIFCDPEVESEILNRRPKSLLTKTKIIPIDFEDFELIKYRQKIIDNRKQHPYYFDPRNTASYYLFCMVRYIMLKKVIKENPFDSSHFAWINICIERMGLQGLDDGLKLFRDKFSTCYIDYISPYSVYNLQDYYLWGRCSMCSGFFTGNKQYMYEFCSRIEEKFLDFLEKGYGHADEQLFLAVYFDNPKLFKFYYGDYQQMIKNYAYIRTNINFTINLLINKSYQDQNWKVCYDACKCVWKSHSKKYDNILPQSLISFLQTYFKSAAKMNKLAKFMKTIDSCTFKQLIDSL